MDWKEFCNVAGWGNDPQQGLASLVSEVSVKYKRPVVYTELLAHVIEARFNGAKNTKQIAGDVKDAFFASLMAAVEKNKAVKISGPELVEAYESSVGGVGSEAVYKRLRDSMREDIEKAHGVVGIKFIIGPAVYFFCSLDDAKKVGASGSNVAPLARRFANWLYKTKYQKSHYILAKA